MSDGASIPDPLIRAEGLAVHFKVHGRGGGMVRALDGVDIEWRPGEVLGVVGESGSGKSTLARALLGLVQPSAGAIELEGSPVRGRDGQGELRRLVQMVFQDPYQVLDPRQSVRSVIAETLAVRGMPKESRGRGMPKESRAAAVGRVLEEVGLAPDRFLDRFPHQLSGGQRQRVAIAAATAMEPRGLICDEPVSMLDVSIRAQILEVLVGLRDRHGMALLFITHDLGLARVLCDRIAVMYLGRIVEHGPASEVIGNPRHPYTRALLDAIPSLSPPVDRGRTTLDGESPDPAKVPHGCRFHPRCPLCFEDCDKNDPALEPVAGGHLVACLYEHNRAGVASEVARGAGNQLRSNP